MNCKRKFWKIAVVVIAGLAALGFITMSLWNWLMPSLFSGVHQIDYLQALGLLVLSRILFGGFRGGRGGGWHGRHERHERWEAMSEEERQKFKEGMRGMHGFRGRWGRDGMSRNERQSERQSERSSERQSTNPTPPQAPDGL